MHRKLRMASAALALTSALAGVGVAIAASPASACTDLMSVSPVTKSSTSHAQARASVCAAVGWTGNANIEQWRGLFWDDIDAATIRSIGTGGSAAQGVMNHYSCRGKGTYTYRGSIWLRGPAGQFTPDEYSAQTRFPC